MITTTALDLQTGSVFGQMQAMEHENLVFCQDGPTGLKAIIAVHNTNLGPALGGCRIWHYDNEAAAVTDALRLSRGMTYKNSIAGLNLGGGKAVIISEPGQVRDEAFFRRFGRFVNDLGGKYITAEDVGISTNEIAIITQETKHVSGKPESMGGGGDPSPITAYTVYLGMKASAKKVWGTDSLAGKRVAVQGVGHVGQNLLGYLQKEGAVLFVSDYYQERAEAIGAQFGATVVGLDEIYDLEIDIYAPCALGATINDDTIDRLQCRVIAGAANNQLKDEVRHGYMLKDRGIVYAPDFLINCGGVINVYHEIHGYNRANVMTDVERIYDYTYKILTLADQDGISTHEAAMNLARHRVMTGTQIGL